MLMRSIYDETPEGAVLSRRQGPQQREMRKAFRQTKASWGG